MFNGIRLGVHSVKDCVCGILSACLYRRQYLLSNKSCLALLGGGAVQNHLLAVACVCPQAFALSALVVFYYLVCTGKDILGGAVVLLQPYNLGVFILILKGENIFDCCPAEFVDTLIVVSDYADIFALS